LLEQPNACPHIRDALMRFSRQNVAKLVEQRSRRNHCVVADAVLKKIAANAPRDERSDQHVRIEHQFHETRLNTSSSVKVPRACAAAIIRCRSWRNRRTKRKSSSDWRSTSLREMPSSLATLSSSRRTACGRLIVTVSLMAY